MIRGLQSALSSLLAHATKLGVTAHNTANVNTDGFKKSRAVLSEAEAQGVKVDIRQLDAPGPMVYEQTENGAELVEKSNVELAEEMVDLITTRRGFQANLKTVQTADEVLGTIIDMKR